MDKLTQARVRLSLFVVYCALIINVFFGFKFVVAYCIIISLVTLTIRWVIEEFKVMLNEKNKQN